MEHAGKVILVVLLYCLLPACRSLYAKFFTFVHYQLFPSHFLLYLDLCLVAHMFFAIMATFCKFKYIFLLQVHSCPHRLIS